MFSVMYKLQFLMLLRKISCFKKLKVIGNFHDCKRENREVIECQWNLRFSQQWEREIDLWAVMTCSFFKVFRRFGDSLKLWHASTRIHCIITRKTTILQCVSLRNVACNTGIPLFWIPTDLFRINTGRCTDILLCHHFINTRPNSNMFQPLKVHLQWVGVNFSCS
jgi:hypothetical protein